MQNWRGWYSYDSEAVVADLDVENLILSESARKDIKRRRISDTEIMETVLAVMRDEGKAVQEEGITSKPGDTDVVLVNGNGLPRWQSGPMAVRSLS